MTLLQTKPVQFHSRKQQRSVGGGARVTLDNAAKSALNNMCAAGFFTMLVISAGLLGASEVQLPSSEDCHGVFYGISEYSGFGWRDARVLEAGKLALKDGEHLAFEANSGSFGDEQFKSIVLILELRHLSLVGTQVTDAGLKAALDCSGLKSVNIWSCSKVSNKGVENFKNCKDIYSFSLGATNYVDEGWLECLANWPKLTELRVDGTSITGSGFKYFAHTPLLERIEGWNVYKLEDKGLDHISKLPRLRDLELWECGRTTREGMGKLASAVKLERLCLVDCGGVDDEFVSKLAALKELKDLKLSWISALTDAGAAKLAALKSLMCLSLSSCESLTDLALDPLKDMVQLEVLDVSGNDGITNRAIAKLKHLKKIKNLNLAGTRITDVAIDALKELQTLEVLNVKSTGMTSEGVELLKKALPNAKINEE